MKLSRRLLFFIISALQTVALGLLYILDLYKYGLNVTLSYLSIIILSYILIFRFYGKLKEIYPKLIYWFVLMLVLILFPYFFQGLNLYTKIVFYLICGVLSYFNGLAINIYLVAEKKKQQIPLLQAAKLVISTSIVGIAFFGSTIIYKLDYFIHNLLIFNILQPVLFFIFYFFIFQFAKWFYYEQKIGETYYNRLEHMLGSLRLFSIIAMVQLSLVLNFFPFEDIGKGMILAAASYVLINLIQTYINRNINKRFILESYFILIFIYLLAYFL